MSGNLEAFESARHEAVSSLPIRRAADLIGKTPPTRRWIVPGLVPARTVTILSAHGGVGKTIAVLQLMAAASNGALWLGREIQPCATFGVFAEDDHDELHRRLFAIRVALDIKDMDALEFVSLADRDAILAEPIGNSTRLKPTSLFASIREHALAMDARLVVLDPAADLFGGNEIERAQVRSFISMLRKLAMDIDGAVLLTAHPSREGLRSGDGYSGSTAWHNSVRSLLYLTRPPSDGGGKESADVRLLRHLKCNFGPRAQDLSIRWYDGAFVADKEPTGMVGAIKRRAAREALLAGIQAALAQGRNLSDHANAPNYAPKVVARMQEGKGFSKRDLTEAMESLFASGQIKVGTPFMRSNRHPARGLVIVESEQT